MEWSDESKVIFRRHLCDIYYYIFGLNYSDLNPNDIDVLVEGQFFKDQMRRAVQLGIESDINFCNYIIENGNKILYIYYYKNKDINFVNQMDFTQIFYLS